MKKILQPNNGNNFEIILFPKSESQKTTKLQQISGPLMTIAALVFISSFNDLYKMNSIHCLFALFVILSLLFGGIRTGILSGIIVTFYSGYYVYTGVHTLSALIINTAVIMGIIFLVDFARKKYAAEIEKFQESKNNLEKAEELSLVMVTYQNIEGDILKVPKSFCDLLGYSQDEIYKMHIRDFTNLEDWKYQEARMQELLRGEIGSIDLEKRYIKKDGNLLWASVNVSLVKDSNGNPLYYLSYVKDISARKKAETALQESEELLRRVVENIPTGVWLADTDFNVQLWNFSMEHLTGVIREEILGKNIFEILPGLVSNGLKDKYEKVLRSGKPLVLNNFVYLDDSKMKNMICSNIIANPLKDSNDDIIGILVAIEDLTERFIAERELKESEERYKTLIDVIPDGIYVQNNRMFDFVNPAGAKLFAISNVENLLGKNTKKYLNYEYDENKIKNLIKNDEVQTQVVEPATERKFLKADGTEFDGEIMSIFSPINGKPSIISIVRDITQRKQVEKLQKQIEENTKLLKDTLEYDKIRTEFFANLSHELRTPLNLILGSLQMMDMNLVGKLSENSKLPRYMGIMRQNGYRLLKLINNLIDLTRIDSGYFDLNYTNSNIVSLVEDTTLSIIDYVENKGLSLEFDTDVEEKYIACDEEKIERVMLNLLSNAVKFTAPGGKIFVNIHDLGEKIQIEVKDSGIGIPKDKLNIIFNRFTQVDKLFTRSHEGSGIGLSIVRSIVQMHDGTIKAESEENKGTTFIVELPVVLVQDNTQRKVVNYGQDGRDRINIEFSDVY